MQFPDRDAMTASQVAANQEASKNLTPGQYYRFSPPVKAGAVPAGGPSVCAVETCLFERGYYLGLKNGNHIFQGKPANDKRKIPEQLRESYFHVLFIGGSSATVDPNQTH